MVRIEIVAVGVLGLVLAACTAGGATAVDATAVDATAVDATAVDATAVDWPAPVTATQFAAVEGNHNCLPRFTYDHVVWGLWRSTGSGPHALGAVLDGTSLGGANDMSCELLATAAGTILFTARDVMSPIGPRLVETTTNRTRQLGATFVAADSRRRRADRHVRRLLEPVAVAHRVRPHRRPRVRHRRPHPDHRGGRARHRTRAARRRRS